jgi:hypothetical protein
VVEADGATGSIEAAEGPVGTIPDGLTVTAYHVPPNEGTLLPLVSPGAVSALKVYSGYPSYVAWCTPPDLVIVPNLPVNDAPDAGFGVPVTGGHATAHAPVHAEVVP